MCSSNDHDMKIMSCHDVLTTAKMLLEIVDWLYLSKDRTTKNLANNLNVVKTSRTAKHALFFVTSHGCRPTSASKEPGRIQGPSQSYACLIELWTAPASCTVMTICFFHSSQNKLEASEATRAASFHSCSLAVHVAKHFSTGGNMQLHGYLN